MNSDDKVLKLNYNSEEARKALYDAITNLPDSVEIYLIGGAIRNAIYREFCGTILTQRDYDQVITKGSGDYKRYLGESGFIERPYPSHQDEQVVFSKALNDKAKDGDSYTNWLVFDMHTTDGKTIEENIKYNVAFTTNGCALNARDLYTKSWKEALIQVLPNALDDLRNKKLNVNMDRYQKFPSGFYAMLRFMSVGFSAPSQNEIQLLLNELPNLEHARFDRNVRKVWDYVGGEAKARELVRSLGIDIDVFDEAIVKSKIS